MAHQPPRTSVTDHTHYRTEFAWISRDDPVPAVVMAARLLWTLLNRLCAASDNLPRCFVMREAAVHLKLGGFHNQFGWLRKRTMWGFRRDSRASYRPIES
jgi:hypothetical protein